MKSLKDAGFFTPSDRKTPYNSRHTVMDQLRVCMSDRCNEEAVDATRFCVHPEDEEGVGLLAAQILSRAGGQVIPNFITIFLFVIFKQIVM